MYANWALYYMRSHVTTCVPPTICPSLFWSEKLIRRKRSEPQKRHGLAYHENLLCIFGSNKQRLRDDSAGRHGRFAGLSQTEAHGVHGNHASSRQVRRSLGKGYAHAFTDASKALDMAFVWHTSREVLKSSRHLHACNVAARRCKGEMHHRSCTAFEHLAYCLAACGCTIH
jgi:hypothetical protein